MLIVAKKKQADFVTTPFSRMQVRRICTNVQTDAPNDGLLLRIDTESEEEGAREILSYIQSTIYLGRAAGLMNMGGIASHL
jgi:hypothetical protein